MSTSILYHAFGLKGIQYESLRYFGDSVLFSAPPTDRYLKCPRCGERNVAQ